MMKSTFPLSFIYVTLFLALFTPSLCAANAASKTSAEHAAPVPRRLKTQLKNIKVSDVYLLNHRSEDGGGWGILQQRDSQHPWSFKQADGKAKPNDVVSDGLAADKFAGNGQSVLGGGANQTDGLDENADEQTDSNDGEKEQSGSGDKHKDSGSGNDDKQSGDDDNKGKQSDDSNDEKQSDDGNDEKQSDDGNDEKQSDDGTDGKQSDDGNDEKQSDDGNDEKQSDDGSPLQESNPQEGQSWNYPGYPGYQPEPVTGGHLSNSGDRGSWNDLVGYDVDSVLQQGEKLSTHSWEFGILSEALLEYYSPSLSVFSKGVYASGKVPKPKVTRTPALAYAITRVNLTHGDTLVDGDGANGDPASLVTPAVLIGQSDQDYIDAAGRQIDHLEKAPKYYNGAISQRDSVAELWADALYMIHPALASWSVEVQDTSYVLEAARQAGLYREILQANTTAEWKGLWTHIVGPQSQTLGIWLTGNGWAAMGMSRVLATLLHWPATANTSKTQQANLKKWIYEILHGAKNTDLATNGLLKNYLVGGPKGQDDPPSADYGDATGTAMLAAVVFRMAVLDPGQTSQSYISWATKLLKAVSRVVSKEGLVTNTVNPLNWFDTQVFSKGSPEGQSSTAILAASFRDCVYAGICNSS